MLQSPAMRYICSFPFMSLEGGIFTSKQPHNLIPWLGWNEEGSFTDTLTGLYYFWVDAIHSGEKCPPSSLLYSSPTLTLGECVWRWRMNQGLGNGVKLIGGRRNLTLLPFSHFPGLFPWYKKNRKPYDWPKQRLWIDLLIFIRDQHTEYQTATATIFITAYYLLPRSNYKVFIPS